METGVFVDKSRVPLPQEALQALADTAPYWVDVRAWAAEQFAPLAEEWVYSGAKYGWSLRLKQKKRAVVYLTPCAGFFRASFALGEAAVAAAGQSRLAAPLKRAIEDAPKFPEGRALRIEVRTARQVPWVKQVATIKMAH